MVIVNDKLWLFSGKPFSTHFFCCFTTLQNLKQEKIQDISKNDFIIQTQKSTSPKRKKLLKTYFFDCVLWHKDAQNSKLFKLFKILILVLLLQIFLELFPVTFLEEKKCFECHTYTRLFLQTQMSIPINQTHLLFFYLSVNNGPKGLTLMRTDTPDLKYKM